MSLTDMLTRAAVLALPLLTTPLFERYQSRDLVEMQDLAPREHRVVTIELSAATDLAVRAVGAEPRPESRRDFRWSGWEQSWGAREERQTWPAAAWILDATSREVVWDLRTARTERSRSGVRTFDGTVRLDAGRYEVHMASFAATGVNFRGDIDIRRISDLIRGRSGRITYHGPYVEDGSYRDFGITVRGAGRVLREEATPLRAEGEVLRLAPREPGVTLREGFELTAATEVEVVALGELMRDGGEDEENETAYDYAWIMDADSRERLWTMTLAASRHAGGALKNRIERRTLRLPAGRYVAYMAMDGSHGPDDWNVMPPTDPSAWGLTVRVTDAADRGRVRPYAWSPVPDGEAIVAITGVGDDEHRREGFALRQPLDVRIYALGEGSSGRERMYDYAYIVNADTRQRVWEMTNRNTMPAGGDSKNRLFDGMIRLEAGNYYVYYTTDGSYGPDDWGGAPPPEAQYWGVTLFPARGRLDRAVVGPFERRRDPNVLAELVGMRDDIHASRAFSLERGATVRVLALGEGISGTMYDYAWIEDAATRRTVWRMEYRDTEHAGGADKNRQFSGEVRLPAGDYVLHYRTDGSHAYGDWNDDEPDDPEAWGVTLFRRP